MTETIYPPDKSLQEVVDEISEKGRWTEFPYGGCSCTFGKCNRLHEDGTNDFYEPGLGDDGQWADPNL